MKQYKYEMRWWIIIISTPLFGAAIPLFYHKASTNTQGLLMNGLIELSPSSATVFYAVLCTFSILFVFGMLFATYSKLRKPVFILLDHEKISIPPIGFFQKETATILFSDIESIGEQIISGNAMLTINYNGKKSIIHKNMLRKSEYLEIKNLLAATTSNN